MLIDLNLNSKIELELLKKSARGKEGGKENCEGI